MLHALYSFQFRIHTTVFVTLVVALLGTVIVWAGQSQADRNPDKASRAHSLLRILNE